MALTHSETPVAGVCLLLSCGAPAAGKSSLVRHVEAQIARGACGGDVVCHTLQLDAIMSDIQQRRMSGEGNGSGSIDTQTAPVRADNWHPFNVELWHEASLQMFQRCEAYLKTTLEGAVHGRTTNNSFNRASDEDRPLHVVVVDDNFHLPSMRHKYKLMLLRIVQEILLGSRVAAAPPVVVELFEALITAPIDDLLRRNRQREPDRRIPEGVVAKLHDCFAAEDATAWQTCVGASDADGVTAQAPCVHAAMAHRKRWTNNDSVGSGDATFAQLDSMASEMCKWIAGVVSHAEAITPHPTVGARWHTMLQSLRSPSVDAAANERAVSSFGHRLDQSLRRVVAMVIRTTPQLPSHNEVPPLAQRCAAAKRNVLAMMGRPNSNGCNALRAIGSSCATVEELDRYVFEVFARVAQLQLPTTTDWGNVDGGVAAAMGTHNAT